ncbi:hypothetical protein [Leisingera thetidis]|uniref:hypothetical protein n=1 Tax=Leisingera thetidis TaxID=2930199 RepID=UPI0021F7C265|nr:hypothetical protein [Leisingera thetidis]
MNAIELPGRKPRLNEVPRMTAQPSKRPWVKPVIGLPVVIGADSAGLPVRHRHKARPRALPNPRWHFWQGIGQYLKKDI